MSHLVLYIHGMGGGEDSRIPSILDSLNAGFTVIVRIWNFDPAVAVNQIGAWIEELHPDLVVAESLGANVALAVWKGPVVLVSPALGAPAVFGKLSPLAKVGLVKRFFEHRFRPKRERRQSLDFSSDILDRWKKIDNCGAGDNSVRRVWAFFGTRDHYYRSGVVSIKLYEKLFGNTYTVYDGTHFMENEYVETLLKEKIIEFLEYGNLQA